MPIGRVIALIGGLALVAAYFMPWFAIQGLLLSGSFLAQFLGSPGDLRRFMPGTSPSEAQLLRGVVYLFPISGLVAAALALAGGLRSTRNRAIDLLLVVSALVPLAALGLGVSRLPAGATFEVGLWLIGAGALAILLVTAFDVLLGGRSARPATTEPLRGPPEL